MIQGKPTKQSNPKGYLLSIHNMNSPGFQDILLTERIFFYIWLPAKFNRSTQEWNLDIKTDCAGVRKLLQSAPLMY
ncbi:MAG: hypothetical protein A3K09_05445 [Nitrospinae bacterium RIFCSPLOWO2_12_FULL_47_7]|nr:MAG: hypothetical protein A3K09_05445 [Nitrospinae bacterium RIFCSPLOWO2_12_FULL_47_7]